MMAWKALLYAVTLVTVMIHVAVAKPVDKRGPPHPDPVEAGSKQDDDMGTGLEYDNYLRQVVEVLESDDTFRKKLETANVSDIKSGAIALHLELVNHTIRTKLDEIKRLEVQRLQELALIKMKSMSGVGVNRMDIPGHLDLRNPHSFEMKDLENLIKKTTHDLEEVDKRRRADFKEYEMEKEYEYRESLKELSEEDKKKTEEQHEEMKKRHMQHEKVHHPGSRDQFEEVWEKDDHLDDQDFDPRTFFNMHDLNSDGMWDIQEVEALLQREVDKMYDARNSPEEDDPNDRYEEMSRMREHIFTEIDTNKDFMITLDEFITYTGKHGENAKFKEDDGWETLGEKPEFTDDELEEYIRQHHPDSMTPHPDPSLQFQPEDKVREQMMQQQMHQQGMQHPQQGMPQQQFQQGQGMQHPQQGMQHPQQGMQHPQQGMPQQQFQQGQGMQHPQQGMQHPQQGMAQQQFQQGQGVQHPQQGMQHPQQGFQQGQGSPQQGQGLHQQGQGLPQQGQGLHQQAGGQQQQNQIHPGQPVPAQPQQGQGQPIHGQGQPIQGQGQPVQGHPPKV